MLKRQNSKTSFVTKPKTTKLGQISKLKYGNKTQILNLWLNLNTKTQIAQKLINSKSNKTENQNCEKMFTSNCDKTLKHKLWQN